MPVEDVEREAAGLAAVEPVGAGQAVLRAPGDDVAPLPGAALRPHDGLGGQACRRQLGGVGQPDEGAPAEAQRPAPAGAVDPGRVTVVGRVAAAQAAVEAEGAAVEGPLAAALVEAPRPTMPVAAPAAAGASASAATTSAGTAVLAIPRIRTSLSTADAPCAAACPSP